MKEDQSKLLEKIIIKGSMKPSWHNSAGYKVELNGVKFFSPFECFNTYVLGEGDNEHKVRVNDETYIKIKSWIQEKIVPYLCKGGNKVCSSYGIKHMAEDQLGFYVSNETVKIIMCELGVIKKRNKVQWDINLYYPYKGIVGIEKYERM